MIEYEGPLDLDLENFRKEKKKTTLFFKMIHNWFSANKKEQLTPQQININRLIESESFLFLQKEIDSGYKLTENQREFLDKKILDKIKREGSNVLFKTADEIKFSNNVLFELTDYLFNSSNTNDKKLEKILSNKLNYYYFHIDFLNYFINKNEEYLKKLESSTYFKYGYKFSLGPGGGSNIKDKLVTRKDKNEVQDFVSITHNLKDILMNNIEDEKILSLTVKYIQSLKEISLKLDENIKIWSKKNKIYHFDTVYSKERNQLGINILEASINDMEQNIKEYISKKSHLEIGGNEKINKVIKISKLEEFKKDLPVVINNLLIKIEESYNYCFSFKEKLDPPQWKEIERLYEEILPQSISQYLSIHPNKRDSELSSQDKTATELLVESLKDINDILYRGFEYINSENIKGLSSSNRYITNIKKTF